MKQRLVAIVGSILLFPGLFGSFIFAIGILHSLGSSAETRGYGLMFALYALPCIQAGCFGLWLLAKSSASPTLRLITSIAGWFGAAASVTMVLIFVRMAVEQGGTIFDKAMFIGGGLVIAGVTFLFGGLPAISVKPKGTA